MLCHKSLFLTAGFVDHIVPQIPRALCAQQYHRNQLAMVEESKWQQAKDQKAAWMLNSQFQE